MITKGQILDQKSRTETALYNYCVDYLANVDEDYRETFLKDLAQHGCQSGMVGELTYYTDTCAFYEKYKKDIDALLYETMESTGFYSPAKIFGDKWEECDPIANDTQNQNLLAWFAFEETMRVIAEKLGVEV